jgi:hypothetical protein
MKEVKLDYSQMDVRWKIDQWSKSDLEFTPTVTPVRFSKSLTFMTSKNTMVDRWCRMGKEQEEDNLELADFETLTCRSKSISEIKLERTVRLLSVVKKQLIMEKFKPSFPEIDDGLIEWFCDIDNAGYELWRIDLWDEDFKVEPRPEAIGARKVTDKLEATLGVRILSRKERKKLRKKKEPDKKDDLANTEPLKLTEEDKELMKKILMRKLAEEEKEKRVEVEFRAMREPDDRFYNVLNREEESVDKKEEVVVWPEKGVKFKENIGRADLMPQVVVWPEKKEEANEVEGCLYPEVEEEIDWKNMNMDGWGSLGEEEGLQEEEEEEEEKS